MLNRAGCQERPVGPGRRYARVPIEIAMSFLCALLVAALVGVRTPTADEYHIYSHVLKLSESGLFANDLIFSRFEPQYAYITRLYQVLDGVASYEWVSLCGHMASLTVLIFALTRIAAAISRNRITHLALAFVLAIGGTQMTLLGGHHLASNSFYPEYTGFALSLLMLAMLIEQRLIIAACCTAMVFMIYPLAGIYAGILALCMAPFIRATGKERGYAAALFVLGGIAGLGPSVIAHAQSLTGGNVPLYLNMLKYIRSSGHFDPAAWLGKGAYLTGAITVIILLWHLRNRGQNGSSSNIPGLAYVLLLALTIVGTLNVAWFMVPWLFMANPMKISPLLIGLFYCYGVAIIADRIKRKLLVSTLLLLTVHDFMEFVTVLLALTIADTVWARITASNLTGKGVLAKTVTVLTARGGIIHHDLLAAGLAVLAIMVFPPHRHIVTHLPVFAVCVVTAAIAFSLWGRGLKTVCVAALAGIALVGIHAGTFPRNVEFIRPVPEFADICAVARVSTPRDACIVIPPEFHEFQVLSHRAAFVSFRHCSRFPATGLEWLERMKLLRAFPERCGREMLDRAVTVDLQAYYRLTAEEFRAIRAKYGYVTYCIVAQDAMVALPIIYENRRFKLCLIQ